MELNEAPSGFVHVYSVDFHFITNYVLDILRKENTSSMMAENTGTVISEKDRELVW